MNFKKHELGRDGTLKKSQISYFEFFHSRRVLSKIVIYSDPSRKRRARAEDLEKIDIDAEEEPVCRRYKRA